MLREREIPHGDIEVVLTTALGHGVVTAESAEKAVTLLDVISPDLLITDVHMGAMSGIELCARIKSDPRYELTPVVVLTAVADIDARVAGLAAGADDFFPKPVDFNELRARLGARIISVVDVFDALHTERPYKPALRARKPCGSSSGKPRPVTGTPRSVTAFLGVLRGLDTDSRARARTCPVLRREPASTLGTVTERVFPTST